MNHQSKEIRLLVIAISKVKDSVIYLIIEDRLNNILINLIKVLSNLMV